MKLIIILNLVCCCYVRSLTNKFSKSLRFQFRDVGFNEMNMHIDNSPLKDSKEYINAKKFLVRQVENKYIKYISLLNITTNTTENEPLVFVFIKIVPVIRVMSIEFILLPYKNNYEISNIIFLTYEHLRHLCELTDLNLDFHSLKYNDNDRWFLEFSMCQT